jgi:hypothetical protein
VAHGVEDAYKVYAEALDGEKRLERTMRRPSGS